MSRLGWVDFLAVVWVLAVLIWLGLRLRRQGGRGFSSFLLAGRRLPWWLLGTSMVATTFAADTPLGVSGLVGQQGIAGNWFWWSFLFGTTLTVSLFAGPWRRSRLATDVELIRLRYGGFFGGLLRAFRSLYMSFLFTGIILGWVLKAMALVLEVSLDLDASARSWVLAALVFLSLAYTLVSGLWGVVMTDFLQFVLAMAGSVTLA
ncbi:MAG: sodium:proline symporter, partial [Planctomycetota bacterium]